MSDSTIKVLLVEDEASFGYVLQERLAGMASVRFDVTLVERLSEALHQLNEQRFDVVLLDLVLPDSEGFETFGRIHSQSPEVPIVILTGLDDETLGVRMVQEGAQDYLIKSEVDSGSLVRSIRHAIERNRLQILLRAMAIIDDLTGLLNRRGFLTVAQQQLKMADRTKRGMLLFFADLDNLKWINDTFGHQEGDLALTVTARLFKQSFRESDIIARMGGDEFAVLAVEASEKSSEMLMARLQENLKAFNERRERRYVLSMSIGTAHYDPEAPISLEELLSRADAVMYEQKRSRKKVDPTQG